jgi:hypothetical protein
MKKILGVLINIFILFISNAGLNAELTNKWSYELSQAFSKDLFELNGVPFMKPMVEAVNATSNSRFFNQAFVPSSVEKPYFRFSVNMMLGIVREDMKYYKPQVPMDSFSINKLSEFVKITPILEEPYIKIEIGPKDTARLIHYLFKTILYDGVKKDSLHVPQRASTILGSLDTALIMNSETLHNITKSQDWYKFLPQSIKDSIANVLTTLPSYFTFPTGGNINSIFAGIPQFEIGSLWGTEALIRFIPPINMGTEIGKFAFWGFGLKHSISQYFNNFPIDLAVQAVYQGTYLNNTIGITQSELNANTTIWDFNIQASRNIKDWFDFFTGLSFERIDIKAKFKFYLPVEIQGQLGLLETYNDEQGIRHIIPYPTPGFEGDKNPQTSEIEIDDFNIKWVIGLAKQIGPIVIYADYNISKFNIFSFGIEYRLFDIKREDYGNYY